MKKSETKQYRKMGNGLVESCQRVYRTVWNIGFDAFMRNMDTGNKSQNSVTKTVQTKTSESLWSLADLQTENSKSRSVYGLYKERDTKPRRKPRDKWFWYADNNLREE